MFLKIAHAIQWRGRCAPRHTDRALFLLARDARTQARLRKLDLARLDRSVSRRRDAPGNLPQPGRAMPRMEKRRTFLAGCVTSMAISFQVFAINCAHLGCPVRWFPQSRLFMCPCHGGAYYEDGSRASGSAGAGLVRILRSRSSTEICTSRRARCPRPAFPLLTKLSSIRRGTAMRLIRTIGNWLDRAASARRADPRDDAAPDSARYRKLVLCLRQRGDDGLRVPACHRNPSRADLCALSRRGMEQFANLEPPGNASDGSFARCTAGDRISCWPLC